MKDIDFDELDKAVNSLMGAAPTPQEPPVSDTTASTEPDPKVQTSVNATPSPSTTIEPTTPPSAPAPTLPTPRSAAAPAQRRGGRFMDMVHASSDMKGSRTPQPTPSREGIAVMPRAQSETPETPPVSSAEDTAVAAAPAPEPTWPDPLELTTTAKDDEPKATEQPAAATNVVAPTETAPAVASETPQETPFLSDAKVEKRPLNPGTPPVDETQAEPAQEPVVATDATETPRPFVPAELSSDLVAIESGEPKKETAPETAEQPSAPSDGAAATPKAPTGASSIAQQYREQPSSGDQSHAAIYDASQFPAPLGHPAKKKSGWLWIVWVIILLALGAGGAVALYLADII